MTTDLENTLVIDIRLNSIGKKITLTLPAEINPSELEEILKYAYDAVSNSFMSEYIEKY